MSVPVQKNEDIIAESILKRAEIARITRQLKTRLAKAGIKAKIDSKIDSKDSKQSNSLNSLKESLPDSSENSHHHNNVNMLNLQELKSIPPSVATKRPSSILENNDSDLDFEVSPTKKLRAIDTIPSSPFQIPSTPPSSHSNFIKLPSINLLNSSMSINEDKENDVQNDIDNDIRLRALEREIEKEKENRLLSTPKSNHKRMNSNLLKTPTGKYYNDDEGADLLMFLATSPSPAAYKINGSFTPKSSGITLPSFNLMSSPSISSVQQNLNIHASKDKFEFITPATPKRLNVPLSTKTPTHSKQNSNHLLNTPSGFNVNDYLNFFTPSPKRIGINSNFSKTPDLFSKMSNNGNNISGKMLNFDKVTNFGITTNSNGVARFTGSPLRK